jgi:hypothetical protein
MTAGPGADGADGLLPSAELRSLIREVLRDVLPALAERAQGPQPALPQAPRVTAAQPATTRPVALVTDEDLREFALEIVRLADSPARRQDLLTGRLRFTLVRPEREIEPQPERRVETGAVTERAVQAAAKAGQRLVLGPRAVLTPLARDRALALGVPIEKER